MTFRFSLIAGLALAAFLPTASLSAAENDGYYKEPPQFHYFPDPKAPRNVIGRLGPIGLGIELRQPAFTMLISHVEEGSPAALTGKLKNGQFIESINGEVLKDIDPRVQLGNMITKIEATDGVVKLMIKDSAKDKAYPVEFKIPVLGPYSDTWPVNCEKSDTIVRNFAHYLDQADSPGWGAALFMLSTGEEKDLNVVRRWFSGKLSPANPGFPWSIGYTGPAICEYYLRTGDASVLPAIKSKCDYLKRTIYNGSWMGRGAANYSYMAGGHMNAAGVHCLTFLLMAKECGVDVDEYTLRTCLEQFFRYVGHGNVPYGDGLPEGGFVDNGRVGGLAFAMQAAANLSPAGEASIYAKARDISATKSFYSTSWLFHGHTGGGIGELWRGPAMGLVKDKRPEQYRTFMNERRWMYELARSHDGSFAWPSGFNVNYTQTNTGKPCGNYIPLIYTLPRKKLRLYGAPPTKYSKTYQLPKRPWGTAADDVFYSLQAGKIPSGKQLDISRERLRTDASMQIMRRLDDPAVSDETLLLYAHHIDQGIRASTAGKIVKYKRYQLILPLLKSNDPRGRHTGLCVMKGGGKNSAMDKDMITDEMFDLVGKMVEDPKESWWVVEAALEVLAKAHPARIAQHVDRLAYWLQHDEWWLRRAALIAATPICTDPRYYKKILPIVGDMVAHNERAVALSPVSGIVRQLQTATPEVQKFGVKVLGEAYSDFPRTLAAPGGQDMSAGVSYLLNGIARNLAAAPGGLDELYQVGKERFPDQTLPHLDIYMRADASTFGPVVKKVFEPLMRDQLIWQYVGTHRGSLAKEIKARMPSSNTDGLVHLYQKVGVHDYDWKLWGPARDKIKWDYITYDPSEKQLWERHKSRYRKVSWPAGCENWMMPGFDPDTVGWKKGFAPFANNDGKLVPVGGCVGPDHYCGCGNPPNTFWEKEVLLMRAELKLPPMREGYAYRLLVGGRSHVGSGDGSDVWINGKRKEARRKSEPSLSGVGKRQGGKPWGFMIDDTFRKEFTGDTITIAATGFLPIHKSGVKRNYQAFWFEEMKLPSLGEKELLHSLRVTPMLTSAWQTSLDDTDMFQFDGTFVENPAVVGTWIQVGKVTAPEDFAPGQRLRIERNWLQEVTFKQQGRTSDPMFMCSGDMLLDLTHNQALRMTFQNVDGTPYLFIESGGFRKEQKPGWTMTYYVLKKK